MGAKGREEREKWDSREGWDKSGGELNGGRRAKGSEG